MFEILWKPSCKHDKITADMVSGYCPDCGEYVENHWFISRCVCCGLKQHAIIKNGRVVADTKFCRNCGHDSFKTEEVKSLDIVSINYAMVQKKVKKREKESFIQTWIEHNNYVPKLLPSY